LTSENAILSRYFSASYNEGRDKFLTACQQAELIVDSYVHPTLKGPTGEDLAIDTAWAGSPDASRVLVFSCGTHGLEAAAGSATMLRWLDMNGPNALPDGMAVLLIHAINPYGWAWAHRINEDGIDLNRNFVAPSSTRPENPAYEDIHALLLKTEMDAQSLKAFAEAFHALAASKGMNTALTGITSGQYDYANGLSFGGTAHSWSAETLFNIARDKLQQASRILHIDWHTGIGAFGEAHFILDEQRGSETFTLLSSWWPEHAIHCDDVVEGVSISYNGLLVAGLRDEISTFNQADVVNLTIEWGTYEVEAMLQALVMDNWLKNRAANADPALVEHVRAELIERFYPQSLAWRLNILKASEGIYAQAIAGLDSWGRN
jgi:hypothetical protein